MKKTLLIATALIVAACTPQNDATTNEVVSMDKGIVISDARLRTPLPSKISAGYFDVTNHGNEADKLIAVDSPIAGRVELHTVAMTDGVMKMRRVESVDLEPGETVSFKPGGKHLMLFEVDLQEGQTDAQLTLTFENADPVTLIAELTDDPIRKMDDHSNH